MRPLLSFLVPLVLAALVGCGSGRHPETGGVDPATFMEGFSGRWTLDEGVSQDPARMVDPAAIPAQGGGDEPAAAMPGRRRGRAPARSGPDPEAMRASVQVFRTVPETFLLAVDDSTVTTSWLGAGTGEPSRLEVAGDGVEAEIAGQRVTVSAQWDGRLLEIERRIRGGASVVDRIEALPDQDRLLVTRTMSGLGREAPEARLAFDRAGSP